MGEYRVVLTQEAIYDVISITEYIEEKFGERRANRFQCEIEKQMSSLGNPGVVYKDTSFYYRNYSIYQKAFPPSIIFYIRMKSAKEVHIIRVLREEQNWESILNIVE